MQSPIPGPFTADGNTVYGITHGKHYSILRVNGARLTDAAQVDMAAHVARVLNNHEPLLKALRYLEEMATFTAAGKHNCPEIHGALGEARAAIANAEGI